ncbi:lipopolysaccharide assembly protein LapB [Pseudonocardia sp. N23]|uniref:tetratricopeptide repeat protein n=1 Tax=Pseudonocardia sp. N23 TaxID=1987376 RepID=UPI000C0290F3|nr:tetratricopeptide repeat protein [Pseudonocardia sp. N23]GAY12445.1 hypothetical protein TOK_0841 [Pseudonocardia sp. N23]
MDVVSLTVGQYLAKAGGAPLARSLGQQLTKRRWARRVAAKALKKVDRPRPRRALVRWLKDPKTWDFLANPDGPNAETIDSLDEALSRAQGTYFRHVSKNWSWMNRETRRSRAQVILDEVYHLVLTEHDPGWATRLASERSLAATKSVGGKVDDLAEKVDEIRDGRRQDQVNSALTKVRIAQLPEIVRHTFSTVNEKEPGATGRMLQHLTDSDVNPAQLLRDWADTKPEWLVGDANVCLVAGDAAYAYNVPKAAVEFWQYAIDDGAPRADYYRARVALILNEMAMVEGREPPPVSDALATSTDEFAAAVYSVLSNSPDAASVVTSWAVDDRLDQLIRTTLLYRLSMESCGDRITVECLDAALKVLEDGLALTKTSGLSLQRVTLLLARIAHGGSRQVEVDLLEARDLALFARDVRRSLRISSNEAVAMACQVLIQYGDFDAAIRVGSSGSGDATIAEANDAKVRTHVAIAACATDRFDLADECLEYIPEGFDRHRVMAMILECRDQDPSEEWSNAIALAEGEQERAQAIAGLARAGAADQATLLTFAAENPDAAKEIAAITSAAAGNYEEAIEQLRPLQNQSITAALALSDVYRRAERPLDSAQVLRDAADAFGDPGMSLRAATEYARLERKDEAQEIVENLLLTSGEGWGGRADAMGLGAQLAYDAGDMERAIALMRSYLKIRPDDAKVRWGLVGTHIRLRDLEQARLTFAEGGSEFKPRDEREAHVWLQLASSKLPLEELIANGLTFLDQFGRSAELSAHVLSLGFMHDAKDDLSQGLTVQLQQEMARYREAYPAGEFLQEIQGDDVEDLMRRMSDRLRRSEEDQQRDLDLSRHIGSGAVPTAFLAARYGKSYGEVLVKRGIGVIPARHPDPLEEQACNREVDAHRDGDVVIESSAALVVGLLSDDLQQKLRSVFRRRLSTHDAVFDAERAMRSLALRATGTVYYDAESDSARVTEVSAEVADQWATEGERIYRELQSCQVLPRPSVRVLAEADSDEFAPWASCVDLAAARGILLWTDDIAIRRISRALSIRCISTPAVLGWMRRESRITEAIHSDAIQTLIASRVGDFPLVGSDALEVLERNDWDVTAVAVAIARPAAWIARGAGIELYAQLVVELMLRRPEQVPLLLRSAISGLTARYEGRGEDLIHTIEALASLTLLQARLPITGAVVVATTRLAIKQCGIDQYSDPLRGIARLVRDTLASQIPGDLSTRFAVSLFGDMVDEDRQAVVQELFK